MKKSLLLVILLAGCSTLTTNNSDETDPYLIGLHEQHDRYELENRLGIDPVELEWCAAYVDYILEMLGSDGTDSLIARSYLDWGVPVSQPDFFDLVIFKRGTESWQGHVGFYMGETIINGRKYYRILGGNQNNRVSIQLFSTRKVLGIRRSLVQIAP